MVVFQILLLYLAHARGGCQVHSKRLGTASNITCFIRNVESAYC